MLLRGCIDLISKQSSWQRCFLVIRSQTSCLSTDSSLPPKPKRHKNAWVFYSWENFPQTKVNNPGSSAPEILTLLSAKWKSLGKEGQQKYLKLAEDDKMRYETEIQAYRASLTAKDEQALAEEKEKLKLKKLQSIEKKKLKALGIPKRPPNAYVLFSSDFIKNKAEKVPSGQRTTLMSQVSQAADAWAKLPPNEKAKWEELAAAKAKEFKQKLSDWENEMSSKGYLEINETKKK